MANIYTTGIGEKIDLDNFDLENNCFIK